MRKIKILEIIFAIAIIGLFVLVVVATQNQYGTYEPHGQTRPDSQIDSGIQSDSSDSDTYDVNGQDSNAAQNNVKMPVVGEEEMREEFKTLLNEYQSDFHPGTAGCSLVCARIAAKMMDWYVDSKMSFDDMQQLTTEYYSLLETDWKEEFENTSAEFIGVLGAINNDDVKGLIECCGYEPTHSEWSEADVMECAEKLSGCISTVAKTLIP